MLPAPRRTFEATIRENSFLFFSAGLAALLAVLFADPLFVPKVFSGRDLVSFFYPIEKAIHTSWRAGHVPLLLPEISFGRPLAANPNAGAFYPLRIAAAALSFRWAVKLFLVVHVWLAGVGAFVLARFLGSSRQASTVAGLVFALAGPTISEIMYPDFLPGVAAMPFVIFAAGWLARRPSGRAAAVFATFWGLTLLVGDVFTAGLALAGAGLISVEESAPGERVRAFGRMAAASLPGFLIGSIQAIPALLLVPYTVRALGKFPLRVSLTFSVSLWRLLELVVRFPFGNVAKAGASWGDALWSGKSAGFFNTLYVGVFAALALAAARPPRGKRIFPYGLAGFSLVLAVTGFYCPAAWLSTPSLIPLRYPEKLMVGFALASAMLSAVIFDRLLADPSSRLWRGAFAIGLLVGVAAGLLALFPVSATNFVRAHWTQFPAAAQAAAERLPGIFLRSALLWMIGAAVLFAAAHMSSRPIAAMLVVLFAAADLSANRFLFVTTANEHDVLAPPPAAAIVRQVNQGERFGYLPIEDYYRTQFDRDALLFDSAAPFKVFSVFNLDYDAADLYRVDVARQQIYRDSGRWTGLPRYLAAFSARSAIVETGRMPAGFSVRGPIVGTRWVVMNPSAVPLIRFAPAIEEVENAGAAYAAIRDERRDLVSTPVVETGGRGKTTLSSGSFRVLRWEPSDLAIETRTPGAARLIVPRAFYPYRTFRIDGVRAEAEATNFCLSSIAVPAGAHVVRVTEELPGGATGPALSIAGALAICLLAKRRAPTTRYRESIDVPVFGVD